MATKYWIGSSGGLASSDSNWSTSSGGANDTTAPVAGDIATFDGNGNTNCTWDLDVNCSIITESAYSATISLNASLTNGVGDVQLNGGVFDCNGNDFKTTYRVYVLGGTFTCSTGAMTFGSSGNSVYGLRTDSGTFNGGSGDWTVYGIYLKDGTVTFTSGNINLYEKSSQPSLSWGANVTFDHGDGTVTFKTDVQLYSFNNVSRTLYNVILDGSDILVQYSDDRGFDLTISDDFTITNGTFDTCETTTGTCWDLTVLEQTVIDGTLNTNSSTVSLGSGNVMSVYQVDLNSTGVFNAGTGNHTYGSLVCDGQYTKTSGTTVYDGVVTGENKTLGYGQGDFSDGGTIEISYAGEANIKVVGSGTFSLNNLTIKSGTTCYLHHTAVRTTTLNGNLTVEESATFNTLYPDAEDANLTVVGKADIAGTFTGNASTITLGVLNVSSGGTYNATSETTTINDHDENTYSALEVSGTLEHNNGTIKIIPPGSYSSYRSKLSLYDAHLYDLVTDGTESNSITEFTDSDTYIDNNLTVNSNSYCIIGTLSNNVHVTGKGTVSGVLGWTDKTMTGSWVFGSLVINSGGEYNATAGTTTISDRDVSYFCLLNEGTFNHNNGTIKITRPSLTVNIKLSSFSAYNVEIARGSSSAATYFHTSDVTIDNDLTVTKGIVGTYNNVSNVTVTGNVTVSDVLDLSNENPSVSFGSLIINSEGEYSATTSTTSCSGDWTNNGTFTHNNGTVSFGNSQVTAGGDPFNIISVGTGIAPQDYVCAVNSTVDASMVDVTSGQLIIKDYAGVTEDWYYYGMVTTGSAIVGWQADNWNNDSSVNLINPGTGTTMITLSENRKRAKEVIINVNTTFTVNAGVWFAVGRIVNNGVLDNNGSIVDASHVFEVKMVLDTIDQLVGAFDVGNSIGE